MAVNQYEVERTQQTYPLSMTRAATSSIGANHVSHCSFEGLRILVIIDESAHVEGVEELTLHCDG